MSHHKTAIVTGANSGFGRQTVELLAEHGWKVYATMRDVASRNATPAGELRAKGISVVELDVTSNASVDAAAKTILGEIGGAPDVLVNNAGAGFFGLQEAFTPEAVERQYAVNVFGPLRVNRAFLPALREAKRGLIVYVSSIVGRLIFPFGGIYQSSKWAIEALAETSAYELAPLGIDVAIVQPGAYPTEIFGKISGPDDEARVASYGEPFATYFAALNEGLGAAAADRDPADVARAIVALAEAPAGSRPLRTTVPADAATDAINGAIAPVQTELLKAFGFGGLLPKALA
jgi:NAD(P)-dependent dehydrogenase (short-subunit alcohol dehydrogenase family)